MGALGTWKPNKILKFNLQSRGDLIRLRPNLCERHTPLYSGSTASYRSIFHSDTSLLSFNFVHFFTVHNFEFEATFTCACCNSLIFLLSCPSLKLGWCICTWLDSSEKLPEIKIKIHLCAWHQLVCVEFRDKT